MGDASVAVGRSGWLFSSWLLLVSAVKIILGSVFMAVLFSVFIFVLLLLLPFRVLRIKTTNYFAYIAGRGFILISGSKLRITGKENTRKGPAIFISNHTSTLDLFIAMSHVPPGTSGVAKREIVRVPFFGQVYGLSGHLVIDRSRTDRAVAGMQELGNLVRKHDLSVFMWPEGTRSRNGRIKKFKKGFAHLALQTGLPVVPFVMKGAYNAWQPTSSIIKGTPIDLEILPPIDTSEWTLENLDRHVEEVREIFRRHLPSDQQPLPAD